MGAGADPGGLIVLSVAFSFPIDRLYRDAGKPDDSPINQRDEDRPMASDVEKLAAEILAAEVGVPLPMDISIVAAHAAVRRALTQPAASGEVVAGEAVGRFVEQAAQIISGAPFPSGRSMFKARQISDLALAAYASPQPSEDTARLDWLESGFYGVLPVLGDGWETRGECPRHRALTVRAAIDAAITGEKE